MAVCRWTKLARYAAMLGMVMVAGCSDEPDDATTDAGADADTQVDGGDAGPEIVGRQMRFEVASESYFDLPIPSDVRSIDGFEGVYTSWPGAEGIDILEKWFTAADTRLEGWGLLGGIFAHFDGALDPTTVIADEEASLNFEEGAPSIFLVDVDPASSEQGRVLPIACEYRAEAGTYHEAHMVGCLSPFGVVRRPNTRYALVFSDALKDEAGDAIVRSADLERLLQGEDVGPVDGEPYSQALEVLEDLGVEADAVRGMTLFTTHDPTVRLRKINDWFNALDEPQVNADPGFELVEVFDEYVLLRATYDVPTVQTGNRPYSNPPSGSLALDENGELTRVDTQTIRFFVTVPRQAMPEGGFPVLMYMHGSGGRAEELFERGPKPDEDTDAPPGSGPAGVVAPYGVAGFAADFNLHGTRHTSPDTTGLLLYNLIGNPGAAVDNFNVAASEVTLHARLLQQMTIDPAIAPEYLDAGDAPDGLIRFAGDRISAMGQSMGSTIGLPALTVDRNIAAGVFSGSGGVLIEVALKSVKPVNVGDALRVAIRMNPHEELNRFDPILSAVQHVWDLVDPVAHGRHLLEEPHPGVPAKQALQHSGLDDGYFSPGSRAAFSAAMGGELVEPLLEEEALEWMRWVGRDQVLELPAGGNRDGVTAVVTQYEPEVLDGHNVAYQVAEAQAQYGCFVSRVQAAEPTELRSVEASSVEACEP
ncbi:hypothetical protein FRC98_05040 [Lujinxingia vulgaris]|uniref:Uncharacterized protein n=1 Tax=Lujinxingia vulgaris TaxID=2600176 RepID=A0A5C6X8Q3_9DELT|nr:hypothetical protein [Lujinxingia vulgaris]TXD38262.1 hypothetical protein FRC98_05040 [Lujinxingia vulgaris]